MIYSRFMKAGFIKSLLALCLAQQLSGCTDSNTPPPPGTPGTASVSWAAPTSREDGTLLPVGEITSYRVYYGFATGDYQSQVDIPSDGSLNGTVIVDELTAGVTYYFVVTTFDTDGSESMQSSPEIEVSVPL